MIFNDPEYNNFIKNLRQTDGHHLCLFMGLYEPDKKKALKKISKTTGKDVTRFDFNDIVSKKETETFEHIDRLFNEVVDPDSILYFSNGDKLCGAYTGFTLSKVKYATPQERCFLKKIKKIRGLIIIDIKETDNADGTMLRGAHSIIKFPLPKSPVRRILWHLKHYSLHGYDIKTKRPEIYADTSDNF